MLGRLKGWLLGVLAMLARVDRAARGSARLRCRRKGAAPLTRPARGGRPGAVGAKGVPDNLTRARRAASNKGLEQKGEGRRCGGPVLLLLLRWQPVQTDAIGKRSLQPPRRSVASIQVIDAPLKPPA